eukprot:g2658.t1
MYAGEDGDVCVELGYAGKEIAASKGNQPDKSKAGGWPAWFGKAPVDVADLVCRLCGRCLYLVTQIYAPTHVHRSLCVFGCNRAACSLRPEAWRVIRTQESSPADPSQDEIDPFKPTSHNESGTAAGAAGGAGGKLLPTPPVLARAAAAPVPDAWGASEVSWDTSAPDEGDDWGVEASEWGAGNGTDGAGDEATPDIHALLDEQEKRSSKAQENRAAGGAPRFQGGGALNQSAPAGPQANGRIDRQRWSAAAPGADASATVEVEDGGERACFPAKTVSFLPEPWESGGSRAEDKEMEERLKRYKEQEEDRGLVAALDQALGLKGGGGGGGGTGNGGGQQGGGGGVAGIGEKYERTPARAKAVMRFADRVARSPQQVVRYAYGGLPLWSAADPPKEDVPPCACGATRLFEMQLMPALLLQLQVNDLAGHETPPEQDDANVGVLNGAHEDAKNAPGWLATPLSAAGNPSGGGVLTPPAYDSVDPNGATQEGRGVTTTGKLENEEGDREEGGAAVMMRTPSAEDRERLRTRGMDWGVVGIWSCPSSCDVSCEECVVVQLPV